MEPKNLKKKSTTFQNDFTEPEFAAVALEAKHLSTSKRLKIYVADTCKQLVQRSTNMECDKFADNTSDDTTSILDLNDDCLLQIFSYLNPVERLKLAVTCQQFSNVALHQIKVKKEFDFSEVPSNFTLMESRKILSEIGPYMKKISLTRACINNRDCLESLPNYCQSLVELEFEGLRNIQFETWQRVFLSAKNLKSLKFRSCFTDERICSLFVDLTQLECLDLSLNRDLTGEHLSKLKNIIDLNLSRCNDLRPEYFIEVCKSMLLKALNISGCCKLNDDSFRHLVETQPNLESITVGTSYKARNVRIISRLNSLKHIRIDCDERAYSRNLANIVKWVAQHRKDDLESLEIYQFFAEIPQYNHKRILEFKNLKKLSFVQWDSLDTGILLEVSRHCRQLEDLNIAGPNRVCENGVVGAVMYLIDLQRLNISCCEQFKDSLYHRIVDVLRHRKSTSLLTLWVFFTGIKQSLAKENEDIITFSFDYCDFWGSH